VPQGLSVYVLLAFKISHNHGRWLRLDFEAHILWIFVALAQGAISLQEVPVRGVSERMELPEFLVPFIQCFDL
jgi:hypothetical protein